MKQSIKNFLASQSGATAVEYGLMCSLIACVIILALTLMGSSLQNTFNEVSSNLK